MRISNTNGHICEVRDTLTWQVVSIVLGTPIFSWENLSPRNFGTFSIVLPVEWLSFKGRVQKDDVHLYWSTVTEINNEGYAVQVSTDGQSWENVGFVKGQGNTYTDSDYFFEHLEAPKRRLYYKLPQVDFDGRTDESKIISIDNSSKEIATMLNITDEGFKEVRYRLRKKLGLDRDL